MVSEKPRGRAAWGPPSGRQEAHGPLSRGASGSAPIVTTPEDETRVLWATLDAVPDAVVVVAATGEIVAANAQVSTVFGWTAAELRGQAIEILVPPRLRPDHPRRRASYTDRPMGLLQLAAVRRNGEEFTAEISLAPIADSGGLTVATVRDITGRLQLAAEAERIRDELLATVTHELRTPLTSIMGFTELLREMFSPDDDATVVHMLEAVERNAKRELRLVTDLLALAVTNLGDVALDVTRTQLRPLVQEALDAVQGTATARGITLEATFEAGSATPLTVDRHRLLQAVENLLSNAIKFTPPGGRVHVRLQELKESHVITVADTGVGISPEDQPHVFERMYRGASAARAAVPGAGIGLALAKAIVEAHGGVISLHSTEGVGTTVMVQLPLGTT